MTTYYFTFGCGQEHANGFVKIEVEEGGFAFHNARKKMCEKFGAKWSFQYDESKWFKDGISQQEEYGLHEVTAWR